MLAMSQRRLAMEQRPNPPRARLLHTWGHVRVDVHRDRDLGVAQPLLYHFHRFSALEP